MSTSEPVMTKQEANLSAGETMKKMVDANDTESTDAGSSNSGWDMDYVDIEDDSAADQRDSSSVTSRKSVRFHEVEIREYSKILGDNPCSMGAPVTIEWDHHTKLTIGVEAYEEKIKASPRRTHTQLYIPKAMREKLLLRKDYSLEELMRAEELARQSLPKPHYGPGGVDDVETFDLAWESACRKFRRWKQRRFGGKTPDLAELWLQNYKQEQMTKQSGGMKRSTSEMEFSTHRSAVKRDTNQGSSENIKLEPIKEAGASVRHVQSAPELSSLGGH